MTSHFVIAAWPPPMHARNSGSSVHSRSMWQHHRPHDVTHVLPTEPYTSSMTSYICFEDLEASVPLAQLRPSVAFSRCAAHLPHDVDQLHGDELVRSMEIALTVHSKARVVLQCWVLLIMRRQVDARHEKDALYNRLQNTTVSPQEKIRYRRGAMLLCHLLTEREQAEADSLLDRYLVDFFFPWSSAVNERGDTFYLQADGASVVHWVQQALDYKQQNDRRITSAEWLKLNRPASISSPTPSPSAPLLNVPTPNVRHTRSKSMASPLNPPSAPTWTPLLRGQQRRKRRLIVGGDARLELRTLSAVVERWAKRLRTELLHAALVDDKDKIRQVAEALLAPPLQSAGVGDELCTEETVNESADDSSDDSSADEDDDSEESEHSNDNEDSAQLPHANECAVCEAEPKKMEQVWNLTCRHGFCGDCMLARLSQRERRCMYCRAKIVQVIDENGLVFQHYDWTKWWTKRHQEEQNGG